MFVKEESTLISGIHIVLLKYPFNCDHKPIFFRENFEVSTHFSQKYSDDCYSLAFEDLFFKHSIRFPEEIEWLYLYTHV